MSDCPETMIGLFVKQLNAKLADEYRAVKADNARLRAKLTMIHEMSQDHLAPAWQVIENIAQTAASALEPKP